MAAPFDPSVDRWIIGGNDQSRQALHDFIATGHVETKNGRTIHLEAVSPGECDSDEMRFWGRPLEDTMDFLNVYDTDNQAFARVCVSVEDWFHLQHFLGNQKYTLDEFYDAAETRTVERARQTFETGYDSVPTPVLPFNADGTVKYHQEGRSRGLAAYQAGLKRMPVWVVAEND